MMESKEMSGSVLLLTPEGLMHYALEKLLEPFSARYDIVHVPHWYSRQDYDLQDPNIALLLLDVSQVYYNPRIVQELQRRGQAVPILGVDLHWGVPCQDSYLYEQIITPSTSVEEISALLAQHLEDQGQGQDAAPVLTKREVEVLRLLVQGMTSREIGDALCISTHTVTSHRKNLSSKLGIQSLAGLAIYAVTRHYIDASLLAGLEASSRRVTED